METYPAAITSYTAFDMRLACSSRPKCLSSIAPESNMAVGLAWSLPLMSRPTWRQPGSKTATSRPMLQPGTIPGPPTSAAPTLERIPPYKLGMTMTSNCCGRETHCIDALSTIISLDSRVGKSLATALKVLRKRPSANFMMLALWMQVTFLRLFASAKLKANFAMRSDLARVIILRDSTTPGTDWCSRPEYSPSVFSRMMAKSTFLWRVS